MQHPGVRETAPSLGSCFGNRLPAWVSIWVSLVSPSFAFTFFLIIIHKLHNYDNLPLQQALLAPCEINLRQLQVPRPGNIINYSKLLQISTHFSDIIIISHLHIFPEIFSFFSSAFFQAFSVFFICIALTSDMICFLFIPVHWLFFAASTYVWVQYVWHTGREAWEWWFPILMLDFSPQKRAFAFQRCSFGFSLFT